MLVLLPSPLLGGSVWAPVAAELGARGHDVVAVPGTGVPPAHPDEVVRHFLEAVPDGDVVLVPHSNAGLYVPHLAAAREVTGFVFVDAVLPPAKGDVPVAPPGFLAWLDTLADDEEMLPPWTEWWDEADLVGLYPDAPTRRRIEQAAPRLPMAYFRSTVVAPVGWDQAPGAYLAFGDTYAEERSDAERRGWPTATLTGRHLHQLHDPLAVAEHIVRLVVGAGMTG